MNFTPPERRLRLASFFSHEFYNILGRRLCFGALSEDDGCSRQIFAVHYHSHSTGIWHVWMFQQDYF